MIPSRPAQLWTNELSDFGYLAGVENDHVFQKPLSASAQRARRILGRQK